MYIYAIQGATPFDVIEFEIRNYIFNNQRSTNNKLN